jgi:cytochrome P450
MTMTQTLDLLSREFRDDPHPFYAALREQGGGVHLHAQTGALLVLRHADTSAVLRDHRTYSSSWIGAVRPGSADDGHDAEQSARFARMMSRSMIFNDPPAHTRLRALVSKAFTPRAIEALRPRIAEIARRLLDDLPRGETVDIVERFTAPLPVEVIAEMLGVPAGDRTDFARWSDASALLIAPVLPPGVRDQARQDSVEFGRYLNDIVAYRRANPGDDMISRLTAAEADGERLSHGDVVTMVNLLLVAGNETTRTLLTNMLVLLADHRQQHERLRAEPALLGGAIEETLRLEPSVPLTYRVTTKPARLGMADVEAGQPILMSIAAANRDPREFDDPDRFLISRDPNRHLGFAAGIHFCLGAPLARLEASVVLPLFLAAFPEPSSDPALRTRRIDALTRGYATVPVNL